jgi:hypothetical protein
VTWLQFWLWVASFLISDYFRERLPSQTAAGVGDFKIPTATEGRAVPVVVGGTMRVDAPNCIWYGQFLAEEKTVTTGIVFKKEEGVGFRYRLALQYALGKFRCAGMTGIWIGDEKVWDHVADAGGVPQEVVDFTNYDIFGGNDSGGGFSGRFRLFNGADDQPVSAYLRDIIGLDPLPAYRGTSYVMITNTTETSFEGWKLVSSTPETLGAYIGDTNQLRYIRIEVQTFDTVANGGLGDRLQLGNDHHFIGPDANPMAVAYELYLNDRWGRAFPVSDVDLASFQAAAETCYTEGIGFSLMIDEQTSTSEIQDTIEQHADAYIGPNPVTGKIEVTLSRPDYTLAAEFQATDDNIINVEKWNKGDWSQTYNRVRIRYADRAKEWNETHAVQMSPGNRIIQGRTVTKEMRYQGCHTASVAAILAARANRTLSLPQSSGTIILDRTAWQIRPGSIMGLTSSQADETDLAVRVTKIELGDGIGNSLKCEVVADISGNELANVATPPPTDFVPPIQAVIPFDVLDQAALETPFVLMQADDSPNSTPRITTMARRVSNNYPTEYEVVRRVSAGTPTGAYTSTDVVAQGFSTVGTLRNAEAAGQAGNGTLTIQVDPIGSESLDGLIGTYGPSLGNFAGVAVVSPGLADEEWIAFTSIVDDGTGIRLEGVYRSAMDTAWKAHAAGARVWFIWTGGLGMGPEVYTVNNNVEIKLLPRSPNAAVIEGDATALPIVDLDTTTAQRAKKPLPPATITLNGTEFAATADLGTLITTETPSFNGLEVVPTHRLWRTPDIIDSVTGLDTDAAALEPAVLTAEGMAVSAWLYSLDLTPAPDRTQALLSINDQLAPNTLQTGVYNLYFDLADLTALVENDGEPKIVGGGGFSARLEIETRHSPAGEPAANRSHEPLFHDFAALGPFPPAIDSPVLNLHFDGADASTTITDASKYRRQVAAFGTAQIDTAQSVFGGASLLLDNAVGSDYVLTPARREFDVRGSFTLEFRARFTTETAFPMIFEIWDGTVERCLQVYYNATNNQWAYNFSTSGLNSFAAAWHTGSWVPTLNVWYEVALVRDGNQNRAYIDGVQLGAGASQGSTYYRAAIDWRFGGGGDGANFHDGHVDELRITPAALYAGATYTQETVAFDDARGLPIALLGHMDGPDAAATYTTEDLNHFTLIPGNTSEVDTAQFKFGSASLRCDGINSSTTVSDGWIISETVGARNAAFDFKRGDFFMDCHVWFNALPTGDGVALFGKYARTIGDGADWFWVINAAGVMTWQHWNSGQIASVGGTTNSTAMSLSTGVWHHFAVERIGDALYLYFDGNQIAANLTHFAAVPYVLNGRQSGATYFARPVTIGRLYSVGSVSRMRALNGFIDECRIVKNTVLNGAATYVVPTAPTADPVDSAAADDLDVLLWSGQGPSNSYATDNTLQTEDLTGRWLTFNNQARISLPGPAGTFGTSCTFFDGNGDSVSMSRSELLGLHGGDFTIQARVQFLAAPSASAFGGMAIAAQWFADPNLRGFYFSAEDSNELAFHWSTTGVDDKKVFCPFTPTLNQWYHLQVVRSGATLYLFIDGVVQTLDGASDAIGADVIFEPQRVLTFGHANDGATGTRYHYLNGYIQNVKWTRTAEQTTTFTPPAGLFTAPALPRVA